MKPDPDRCLLGIATAFDTASRNGESWSADAFELFLDVQPPVPLCLDHGVVVNSWGVTPRVGLVTRYAVVDYPVRGIAVLAQIEHADGWGDAILHDLKTSLSQQYFAPSWGLSVGGLRAESGEIVIQEVSLTRSPAYHDAMVLDVGESALETWAWLSEERAAA